MATKVIVCPECESPLVPGRFACQSCGVVVAAVASEARSFARAEPTVPPLLAPAAPEHESGEWETVAFGADDDAAAVADEPQDLVPAVAPDPVESPLDHADTAGALEAANARVLVADPQWPSPAAQSAVPAGPSWPAQPAWPPVQAPPAVLESLQRTPAGAYLPPSAVLPSGDALAAGRNGAGDGPAPGRRSLAERFALGEEDGPLGLPAALPGRTVALGAAIAGFGFLLPWAEIVIGSATVGGFLDQWGLAAPGHWLMLFLLLAVGGLAVAGERTSVRIGTSTPAIVLGALLLGLAFPYVMGPFREAVGVYVTLAGALVMMAGGLLARAAPRHVSESGSV